MASAAQKRARANFKRKAKKCASVRGKQAKKDCFRRA